MGTRLYVGNLPYSVDETRLTELFSQNDRTVVEVTIVTDRMTGRPRGFGFVEMGSDQEAESAIHELNGFELEGRPLTVNEARSRADGPRRGGGGGRRRY